MDQALLLVSLALDDIEIALFPIEGYCPEQIPFPALIIKPRIEEIAVKRHRGVGLRLPCFEFAVGNCC